MRAHDICAVLDQFCDGRVTCGHPGLWRDGAAAMREAIRQHAADLARAAEVLDADPAQATRLLRVVADRVQVMARTLEIGVRMCENAEEADDDVGAT
jgi:hypothetical protein